LGLFSDPARHLMKPSGMQAHRLSVQEFVGENPARIPYPLN
jgi:hypothetical protein